MFIQNLRAKVGARLNGDKEAGFTLIELLVVMLILGILAAIALPAFFNQKNKAGDAKAKETAHSAQVATETYATENNGSYDEISSTKLHDIEPTIEAGTFDEGGAQTGGSVAVTGDTTSYTITVTSSTGNKFLIKNTAGEMEYPCEVPKDADRGGCPTSGFWN